MLLKHALLVCLFSSVSLLLTKYVLNQDRMLKLLRITSTFMTFKETIDLHFKMMNFGYKDVDCFN